MASSENLMTMVQVFRRECHKILESERTTIHGADGMLTIVQLMIAELNKEETGEFGAALSDVICAWKYLLRDKLHLPQEGSLCPPKYDIIRKKYDAFLKQTNTVDLIDVHGMYERLRENPDPKIPLSSLQLLHFLSGKMETLNVNEGIPSCPATPSSKLSWCSTQGLRRLFCSYFGLLVNTKNDLALARVLDAPSRGLGRVAFTDLKHAARTNSTSLFLAATSFVRAIQLGGKGYAPPDSDPLRRHLKGLSDFVHFTDRLEELLGEIPDPSEAGVRIVSSIRSALVKGRSSGDPVAGVVEEVAQDLKDSIVRIHATQRQAACSTGISPARPRAYAINHATVYGGREVVKLLMALLDQEALAPPCGNKASLLDGDLDPFNGTGEMSILGLFRSPEAPTGSSPKPLQLRIQDQLDQVKPTMKRRAIRSQFACTYQDEDLPLNRMLEFPSSSQAPTCVHPAPKRTRTPFLRGVEEDEELNSKEIAEEPEEMTVKGTFQRPVFGQRCANARSAGSRGAQDPTISKGSARADGQTGRKPCKRKDVDMNCDAENCPPLKRGTAAKAPGSKLPPRATERGSNTAKKRKLISGQATLTGFFRM
ncbi:hypothetical protein GJAV_G00160940 [Gymnothorax javanicus]|nr:hypothetical protein GJAV_G00160940 [Gymnothorax javanicus]